MKILHFNQSDEGGAGRAMARLHQGLRSADVESFAFVQLKQNNIRYTGSPEGFWGKISAKLKLSEHISNIPLKRYPQRANVHFSPSFIKDDLASVVARLNPDIVHLHWVNHGFLNIESLKKFNKPIVWTLHDMWPFTGGCHYSNTCTRFRESCGSCPVLNSDNQQDLSHAIWKRKNRAWQNLNITAIAPSQWMGDQARSSSLFQNKHVAVIPNGLNMGVFRPIGQEMARHLLNLPENKQLVLFGAANMQDIRKGMHLLLPALQELQNQGLQDQIELMVFGEGAEDAFSELAFKVTPLGRLADDVSLSLVYSAADVFVAPSLEDNLPNTLVESLACGTPGVGFRIGGIPNIIDHKENGFLAEPYDPKSLAEGIHWVLKTSRRDALRTKSCQKARNTFELAARTQDHIALYEKILQGNKKPAELLESSMAMNLA